MKKKEEGDFARNFNIVLSKQLIERFNLSSPRLRNVDRGREARLVCDTVTRNRRRFQGDSSEYACDNSTAVDG